MRTILFFFAVFLFFTNFSAQSIGFKGGANISTFSKNNDFFEPKIKFGLMGGVFVNWTFYENWSLQPEVLYDQLGSNVKYKIESDNLFRKKIEYLSIPLMVQYSISHKIYLETGPQISFLLSATEKYKSLNGNIVKTKIPSEFINKFDIRFGIGLGYNVSENIGLNIRYNEGLKGVFTNNDEEAARNKFIQIGIFYKAINW